MGSGLGELGISAAINIGVVLAFFAAYSVARRQPINARIYYSKWFVKDPKAARRLEGRGEGSGGGGGGSKHVELDVTSYLHAADWLKKALSMPEDELLEHAGLDAVVFLRFFLLGLKIFVPIAFAGLVVLVPINETDNFLPELAIQNANSNFTYTNIDRLSVANVHDGSDRLWAHVLFTWVFSAWVWLMLWLEYHTITGMRLDYLAAQKSRPDQYTVLVRQVPPDPHETVSWHVQHFFRVNHPDHYLLHQPVLNAIKLQKLITQWEWTSNKLRALEARAEKRKGQRPTHRTGPCGCCGARVDSIDFYNEKLDKLDPQISVERARVLKDPRAVVTAAFVSFRTRWGAAVAAQTQQCRDSTRWITEWAPEPRDVHWANLPVNYLSLNMRRLGAAAAVFGLVFFFMIPITFVQSLANLDSIEKTVPWLKPIIDIGFIKNLLQGFLPGLALLLFLQFLPNLLITLSRLEGWISNSVIERKAAGKYYYFMVVNVFFGNVITGSLFEQLKSIINKPTSIPTLFGNSIPTKATFFMTFLMVQGWAVLSSEILRLYPLLIYHLRSLLLVKTEKDRYKAMKLQGVSYVWPQLELYFLLGLVYCVIAPLLVPFLIVFFAFGYLVYRNQVINVYEPSYESAASYWPHIHGRLIAAQVIQQLTLIGLFSIKKAKLQGPFLIPLPILTVLFHYVFCKGEYENAFHRLALEEAMKKDTLDAANDYPVDVRAFLEHAYENPALKEAAAESDDDDVDYCAEESGSEQSRRAGKGGDSDAGRREAQRLGFTEPPLVLLKRTPHYGHESSGSGASGLNEV
eukprot:SM000043S15819  [mRNA]  locus=s43:323436:330226:+ [translate_table: standard]